MPLACDICGKTPSVGFRVSHAHNRSKRRWLPNLQAVRARTATGNRRLTVCTRCLRSGRVRKAS